MVNLSSRFSCIMRSHATVLNVLACARDERFRSRTGEELNQAYKASWDVPVGGHVFCHLVFVIYLKEKYLFCFAGHCYD